MILILVVKAHTLEKYTRVLLFSFGVFVHIIQNNFDNKPEIFQIQKHSMETTKFGKMSFAKRISNPLPDQNDYSG